MKYRFHYITFFIGGILLFFVAWVSLSSKIAPDIAQQNKITGEVTHINIATRHSINRGAALQKVFEFRLINISTPFGIQLPSEDYSALAKSIQLHDTVTVYYRASANLSSLNTNVYQVQLYNKVVYDYKNNRSTAWGLFSLFLFFGLVSIILGIYQFKKRAYSTWDY